MFSLGLPFVETFMALMIAIHDDAHLAGGQNFTNERSFIPFAVHKDNFLGDAAIQVKADMNFGLLVAFTIIGTIRRFNHYRRFPECSLYISRPLLW